MTVWLIVAACMLGVSLLAGTLTMRGTPFERVAAAQLSASVAVVALVVFAEGSDREVYFDLGLVLSVISYPATLFYLTVLERWS